MVLVVEDDPTDCALLVRMVTAAGYAVESVATAAAAIARCRERRFDAITLDLFLPDGNGLDVLKTLRAPGPNRDTAVIIVTVVAEKGPRAGAHPPRYARRTWSSAARSLAAPLRTTRPVSIT